MACGRGSVLTVIISLLGIDVGYDELQPVGLFVRSPGKDVRIEST